MDVFEARQWELSVVFVCGMIERHFPRYHTGDPLVPEPTRKALGLVTAEEKQEQERSHFEIARSRARERVVFSYPRFDAIGNENLRSFFLGEGPQFTTTRSVRPAARVPKALQQRGAIAANDLLIRIREQHAVLSATRIEDFLQCPFRFFARRTLCLEPATSGPEERFDARVQGRLVHEFIETWRPGMFVDTVFDAIFEEQRSRENLGHGWRTEFVRLSVLRDLRRWSQEYAIANGAEFERRFRIRVAGKQVRGRIDCVEPGGGQLVTVTDFKYSANTAAYVKAHDAGLRVQAGLYVLAAKHQFEREVAGMFFVGLREENLKRKGWSSPRDLEELVSRTEELTRQVAEGIAAGEISVRPADPEACMRCDFREACRVEEASVSRRAGE
jgi:ATP-dependent helicase/DNAse subunit B